MANIRVLVADDHTLVRQGIVSLLNAQPDIEVVGEAANGEDAVLASRNLHPDVVLMDIGMPGLDGLGATRQISESAQSPRVLILTVHDREDYLFGALHAGALGYVVKGADVADLLTAVRSVAHGDVYLYPTAARQLLADFLRRADEGETGRDSSGLTDRERQVLQHLAEGKAIPEIARVLSITTHTVQTHRDHIMEKLGLHTRAELIRYALRKGLIE